MTAPVRFDGEPGTPALPVLAEAMAAGDISGNAAVLVTDSIARARHAADPGTLEAMEASLVAQAAESDTDTLAMVAKTWETAVDQDGAEPSDEELRSRQGMFYRGRRRGLHQFVINTTDDQYEALATVMNSAANPRIQSDAIETAANHNAANHRNDDVPTATDSESDPDNTGTTEVGAGCDAGSGVAGIEDAGTTDGGSGRSSDADGSAETADAGMGTDDDGPAARKTTRRRKPVLQGWIRQLWREWTISPGRRSCWPVWSVPAGSR